MDYKIMTRHNRALKIVVISFKKKTNKQINRQKKSAFLDI